MLSPCKVYIQILVWRNVVGMIVIAVEVRSELVVAASNGTAITEAWRTCRLASVDCWIAIVDGGVNCSPKRMGGKTVRHLNVSIKGKSRRRKRPDYSQRQTFIPEPKRPSACC